MWLKTFMPRSKLKRKTSKFIIVNGIKYLRMIRSERGVLETYGCLLLSKVRFVTFIYIVNH